MHELDLLDYQEVQEAYESFFAETPGGRNDPDDLRRTASVVAHLLHWSYADLMELTVVELYQWAEDGLSVVKGLYSDGRKKSGR